MTKRVGDTIIFVILGFGILLSIGGAFTALGQAQPCPGCYPPSQGTPPGQPSPTPNYNPGIPSYQRSPSVPYSTPYGWTVPVPNQISISNSGQVYFHYGPPYSGMQQTVPVSGINPFTTFNGA